MGGLGSLGCKCGFKGARRGVATLREEAKSVWSWCLVGEGGGGTLFAGLIDEMRLAGGRISRQTGPRS